MEWILQIIIMLISFLFSYLLTTKKYKNEIVKMKIKANKEIEKIKIETEETIKLKTIEQMLSNNKNKKTLNELSTILLKSIIENAESKTNQP